MKRNTIAANRILTIAVAIMLILGLMTVSYGADKQGYSDVSKEYWAYDAVNAMSDKAIIKGYPDGSFKPGNTVTYAEFIKMALLAGTGSDVGNASKPDHWAMNYYNKALELKYFTSSDIGTFQLDNPIARGDMALIISSVLGDIKIENYDELQKGIKDITYQTKNEYDITKAYAAGVLTGYTDNTFKPEKTLTRAESATVIYRLVDEGKREIPGGKKEESSTGYKLVNTADYVDVSTVVNVRKLNPDDKYSTYGDFTEKAELYSNASKFEIGLKRAWEPGWGSSFNHKLNGFIYLVKDKKIVCYCDTTPRYDEDGNFLYFYTSMTSEDVTKADYILVTRGSEDLVKLILNPLKK